MNNVCFTLLGFEQCVTEIWQSDTVFSQTDTFRHVSPWLLPWATLSFVYRFYFYRWKKNDMFPWGCNFNHESLMNGSHPAVAGGDTWWHFWYLCYTFIRLNEDRFLTLCTAILKVRLLQTHTSTSVGQNTVLREPEHLPHAFYSDPWNLSNNCFRFFIWQKHAVLVAEQIASSLGVTQRAGWKSGIMSISFPLLFWCKWACAGFCMGSESEMLIPVSSSCLVPHSCDPIMMQQFCHTCFQNAAQLLVMRFNVNSLSQFFLILYLLVSYYL